MTAFEALVLAKLAASDPVQVEELLRVASTSLLVIVVLAGPNLLQLYFHGHITAEVPEGELVAARRHLGEHGLGGRRSSSMDAQLAA